tara:strand:- start:739 stop:978 length:240 start_codon:yes stop_codon:yes gene_type:complete
MPLNDKNYKTVCRLCNLKTLAVFDKNKKNFIDTPVLKLKGTVDWNGYIYCDYCWCKNHNGPKPTYHKNCFKCYPKKNKN